MSLSHHTNPLKCCLFCILILSLPLYVVSNSFEFRLSFAKEGLPCFFCVHPGGYTSVLEILFSRRVKITKNLRTENTNSTSGSNTTLLQPWSKVHRSQRMSFLLISDGFWSGLHLQSAQAHLHPPTSTVGRCYPGIQLVPIFASGVAVCKVLSVLLPQRGPCSARCVAWPYAFPPSWKVGSKMKQFSVVGLGAEGITNPFAHLWIPRLGGAMSASSQRFYVLL